MEAQQGSDHRQQHKPAAPVQGTLVDLICRVDNGSYLALPCFACPGRDLDEPELASILGTFQQLSVQDAWRFVPSVDAAADMPPPPPALLVAHVLAGSAGPDFRLFPAAEERALADFCSLHKQLAAHNQLLVLPYSLRDLELVLVPVMVQQGGGSLPIFWAYTIPAHTLTCTAQAAHCSRIVVVLNLEDTLLVASTAASLEQRLEGLKEAARLPTSQLQAAQQNAGLQDAEQVSQLRKQVALLQEEQRLVHLDLQLLKGFMADPRSRAHLQDATYKSPTWVRVEEPSYNGPPAQRPVVRLTMGDQEVILTRLHPDKPESSVLVRVRPHWHELWMDLSGSRDGKRRWQVLVCTSADVDEQLAHVLWTLLDPSAAIFHPQELSWRLLAVPGNQHKDLLNVLRRYTCLGAAQPQPPVSDQEREHRPPLQEALPLCVIVDAKQQDYDPVSRQALLQVIPYDAYKDAAAVLCRDCAPAAAVKHAQQSSNELDRVRKLLLHVRGTIYHKLNALRPTFSAVVNGSVPEDKQSTSSSILHLLPPLPTVRHLLDVLHSSPPFSPLHGSGQDSQQLHAHQQVPTETPR